MGLIECAGSNSIWRGLDYYHRKKVSFFEKTGDTTYSARVQGSNGELYTTVIDIAHVKSSQCNCPHANGKRIVCKHKIAVYLTAYPEEALRMEQEYRRMLALQKEAEQEQEELENRLIDFIHGMKKAELEQVILNLLFDGPDWQYEQFVMTYLENNDFAYSEPDDEPED